MRISINLLEGFAACLTGISVTDFVTFTRHDGYAFTVRRDAIAAFMSAADEGALIWLNGAAGSDFHHVRDRISKVRAMVCGAAETA